MRLAFVSLFGLLVGCGGGDGVSINSDQNNFCQQIADVACHNMYQCCTEGEIEQALNVSEPRTENQCRDDMQLACLRGAGNTLIDSIKAGRVTFDSQRMNDCLNAIVAPDSTCASVVATLPWKEACMNSAFVGTVATGGSCFFNHDCAGAPDSFCGPDQKCKQKPTAGFPCGTGCASQYYCVNGMCASKLAAGAPCQSTSQCAENLFCDLDATPMPVCAAKAGGGAACTSNLGCISGTCTPGQCKGTNSSCFKSTDCYSHCANSTISCTQSYQCATGTCMVGGNACTSNTNCTLTNDVCVFPVLCVPGECIGDPPVCTAAQYTVDYCDGTLTALPLL